MPWQSELFLGSKGKRTLFWFVHMTSAVSFACCLEHLTTLDQFLTLTMCYWRVLTFHAPSHPCTAASMPLESTSHPSAPWNSKRRSCCCLVCRWWITLARIQKRICGRLKLKPPPHPPSPMMESHHPSSSTMSIQVHNWYHFVSFCCLILIMM